MKGAHHVRKRKYLHYGSQVCQKHILSFLIEEGEYEELRLHGGSSTGLSHDLKNLQSNPDIIIDGSSITSEGIESLVKQIESGIIKDKNVEMMFYLLL